MHILTFTLRNELFAIDAAAAKEIVWLPELTSAEEMPDYVAGIFNLRGHIVPVMDLNLRLGHKPERYQVTDRIIVSEIRTTHDERRLLGIIVNDVHDVVSVPESDIEPTLTLRPLPEGEGMPHLIAGEVKAGEEIIMLLDHHSIADFGIRNAELKEKHSAFRTPHSTVTPEELAIFHARARTLMQPQEDAVSGMLPFAVVSLSGEYFGVDLDVVKEFADVREVTPVPCTPAHIVGDMNLRGEILTLVDICGVLNISAKVKGSKAVISQVNDLVAGVTVDDVIEVINVSPNDVRSVPASVKAVGNDYIKGELPYQGKMLSILDLQKILTSKEIVVDEEG